jgi:sterol desaturase/sphingolipid hydroxylase (fatty acid hydroxylase superfamily)
VTALAYAGAFALGGLGWTFAEYAIHNWVMHGGKGRNEFSRQHLNHHADPNYFAPLWEKYISEVVVTGALLGLSSWVCGWKLGLAFTGGFSTVYHSYEILHRRLHTHPPRGPIGRFLRRHHMTHHFVAPTKNHGVSFHLWDLLFGTYQAPKKITLPSRHAMTWLIDPATGDVRAEFAGDYALRRTTVSGRQKELDREAAFSNQALF